MIAIAQSGGEQGDGASPAESATRVQTGGVWIIRPFGSQIWLRTLCRRLPHCGIPIRLMASVFLNCARALNDARSVPRKPRFGRLENLALKWSNSPHLRYF